MIELSDKDIIELSDNSIKIAALTRDHPMNVIIDTLSLYDFSIDDKNAICKRCKDYLRTKQNEYPWSIT